jgi:glycosyltransferase involved in cell wall biosynthesis
MRILYLCRRWWPALGGIETFVRSVARELGEEHEVRVLALRIDDEPFDHLADGPGLPAFEPFADGPIVVSPLRLSRADEVLLSPLRIPRPALTDSRRFVPGRRTLTRLYASVVARKIAPLVAWADLVHVWGLIPASAAGTRAGVKGGKPVVLTPFMHTGDWGDDPASVEIYRQASLVLALQAPEAADLYGVGVPAERLAISGACIGERVEAQAPPQVRHPLVLFIGANLPHKGAGALVEAAARLEMEVTVALAGSGWSARPPRQAGRAKILQLGQLGASELTGWLAAADLLCLPSSSETFGLVVLEAWREGTPVLVGEIPALRALVQESGGGRTTPVDPGSLARSLNQMLSRPLLLRKMGAAGREHWLGSFTAERVARRHLELYRTCVESPAAS